MPILLSHNSSLERLRAVPPQVDQALVVARDLALEPFGHVVRRRSETELRSLGLMQRPVHRMVPSRRHSNAHEVDHLHRCGFEALPAGLVRHVCADVYAAGPELTFVEMAGETTLVGAVVLGHELCGTYSHFAQMVSGFYERPPLTSVGLLWEAVGRLGGMRGVSAAREALRWVRDGSASPMETVVSCMLNLPNDMGGFGMVAPELNYVVSLSDDEARVAGTKEPRIDTAYPEVLVGVEFDGENYHRDPEHDRRRREALAHKGWTIYVLDVDELTTYARLREKVALLDAVPRRRGQGEPFDRDARALLRRLLVATRCGVGMNSALFGTAVPRGAVRLHL